MKVKGSDSIGLNEFSGPINRAIYMAFRSQVHDSVRSKAHDGGVDGNRVDNVYLLKCDFFLW